MAHVSVLVSYYKNLNNDHLLNRIDIDVGDEVDALLRKLQQVPIEI